MPVLFEKLYIRTDLDSEVIVLDNVWRWARGIRTVRTGTYRDTGWNPGKLATWNSTSLSGLTPPAPVAVDLPVIGKPESTPASASTTAFQGLLHSNPDEVAHIPPRFYERRESGYLFALTDVAIAEPPAPASASVSFTVNATTNVCAATAHPFTTGDTIGVSGTTLAAPLAAANIYTVLKLSADAFMLRTSSGAVVDFTTAGSGLVAVLVSTAVIPVNEPGVIFVPDAWNPRISTSDPRA